VPVPDPAPAPLPGTWLVVIPAGLTGTDLAQGCVRALTARGAQAVTAEVGRDTDRAELANRIGQVCGIAGVLSLLALQESADPAHPAVGRGGAGTLGVMQALGDVGVEAPLWLLTRGAVAAGAGETPGRPVQAQVWGLGRVARLELPERWGGLVDVPATWDERAAARLCGVLAGCGEDEVAIRGAGILAQRLTRAPLPSADEGPWVPRGSVLITGGTGTVGGHVARWLAGRGAARVVLTSRSGPASAGVASLAAQLAESGTAVRVAACDVADRAELAGLLDRIAASGPPLGAVMHAAGVLDDGVLDGLSTARLASVLAGKAAAAAHLDELTAGLNLDAFVLFSSVAATLGSAGQGNYAAANAYLDALAQNRHGRGLPAVSVAWGPWAGGGLAQASEAARQRLRRGPLPPMDPYLAVTALGQALAGGDRVLAVMDVDWTQFASAPGADQIPFLRDLPEARPPARDRVADPDQGDGELARRLAGRPPEEQVRLLTELVRAQAAGVLGFASAEAVDPERAFSDLGFDSLTAVELRNQLGAASGLRLPATLLFDYPTSQAVAEYLRVSAFGQDTDPPPVMEELDRLESALASIARDGAGRPEIRVRLEAIMNAFDADGAEDAAPDHEIAAATDDEMFDLVEKELGGADFDE
jgi:short-subunit dehydrogenase/acyl carrier protein